MIGEYLKRENDRIGVLKEYEKNNGKSFDTLTHLFSVKELKELLDCLDFSKKVVQINLHDIDDEERTKILAEFLESYKSRWIKEIKIIPLSYFGENKEFPTLCEAFEKNKSIEKIDLSSSYFKKEDLYILLEKIVNNSRIKTLTLNNISLKFTQEIANKINDFLSKSNASLDISNNKLNSEEIATTLKANNKVILNEYSVVPSIPDEYNSVETNDEVVVTGNKNIEFDFNDFTF